MKFEVGKLYRTRSGEIRRVVCVDAPGEWPIISVATKAGQYIAYTGHSVDGSYHNDPKPRGEAEHQCDLIALHREPREWWIALRDGVPTAHEDKIEAFTVVKVGQEIVRVREVLDDE